MDHQNIYLMIAFSMLFGIPFLFLYVRKIKPARVSWKSYALPFVITYGATFLAAFFLARLTDPVSHALAQVAVVDSDTSAVAAKTAVTVIAATLAYLALHGVTRKNLDNVK
jgi:hypothetical protein